MRRTHERNFKKVSFTFILIMLSVVWQNCQTPVGVPPAASIRPPDDQLTWVSIVYLGGKQCDPNDSYTPPDVKQVLGASGIPVFDTAIEYYAVCLACSCPKYAAMHYAFISKDDLEEARELGFSENDPQGGS